MAARIMVIYSDEPIGLNQDTYHLARDELGHHNFVELPARKMKGIDNPGPIYGFRIKERRLSVSRGRAGSLVGYLSGSYIDLRSKQRENVKLCIEAMCDDEERDMLKEKKLLPVLIIKGESSGARSYMLFHALDVALSFNYKVAVTCTIPSFSNEDFYVASRLIQRMLDISMTESCFQREQKIIAALPQKERKNLHLFNHLFDVNFPVPDEVSDVPFRKEQFQKLAKCLMHKFCKDQHTLIAVDQTDYMDDESWHLLHNLVKEEKVLLVFSLSLDFVEENASASALTLKAFLQVNIDNSEKEMAAPVLCWFLAVKAVHKSLLFFLQDASDNKAQLLKEICLTPAIKNCIQIVPFHSLDPKRLEKEFYVHQFEVLEDQQAMACDLKPNTDLKSIDIPTNISNAVKQCFSYLSMHDRLLMKRAAVFGPDFDQHTLNAVSRGIKRTDVIESVKNLLANNVLTSVCTSEDMLVETFTDTLTVESQNTCCCFTFYCISGKRGLGVSKHPISPYHRLMFRTSIFKSHLLGYMTKEQLYNMQMEVVDNLELNGLECIACKIKWTEDIQVDENKKSDESYLKTCMCLKIRMKVYSEISALYKYIGMMLLPTYFKRKAAQAANSIGYPIQALNYVQQAKDMLPNYESIEKEDKKKEESYFDPLVLDVSLTKTKAQSYLILGDTYSAASFIYQGIEMLGLKRLCLHGVYTAKEFTDILPMFDLLNAEYITKLLGVLVNSYLNAGRYNSALELLKIEYVALTSYPIDFLQILNHNVSLYRCKYWMCQRNKLEEIEKNIFTLCQDKLRNLDALLDVTEVNVIGSAYVTMVEINLVLGHFERGENIGTKSYSKLWKILRKL